MLNSCGTEKPAYGSLRRPSYSTFFLAETAQCHPGIAEEADAADAAIQIGDLPRSLVVDQLARQHLHRLRHQRQRRIGARGDGGVFGFVERLRTADNIHAIQRGHGGCGGLLSESRQGMQSERGDKKRVAH